MELVVELEREDDGRWIAEIPTLPGVMAFGGTRDEALRAVEALALRVFADRLEHREIDSEPVSLSFLVAA
jgi:predicted RNase H-like HicB family nuclease